MLTAALTLLAMAASARVSGAEGAGCTPQNVTLAHKLDLIVQAEDHDGDGVMTREESLLNFRTHYDTDHDDRVSEEEWVTRYTCAYGDTQYFARFSFVLSARGEAFLPLSRFTGPAPEGYAPRTDQWLRDRNRERYELFHNNDCVNTDLPLNEKLNRFVNRDNDRDNDLRVTVHDFQLDFPYYDTNNDGMIALQEHVLRWVCAYGDTAAFARYVYNSAWGFQGRAGYGMQDLTFPPYNTTGMPLSQFRQDMEDVYDQFQEHQQGGLVG